MVLVHGMMNIFITSICVCETQIETKCVVYVLCRMRVTAEAYGTSSLFLDQAQCVCQLLVLLVSISLLLTAP